MIGYCGDHFNGKCERLHVKVDKLACVQLLKV